VVQSRRDECPANFDVFNFGGTPSAPKPPAPPTTADAAGAAREQLNKRKPQGFASTILTGGMGDTSTPNVVKKSLLGS